MSREITRIYFVAGLFALVILTCFGSRKGGDRIDRMAFTASCPEVPSDVISEVNETGSKLPKVWMSAIWRDPFDETARLCAAQGVECVEVPTWGTNVCGKILGTLRKHGLKGFTSNGYDTSEDSRGLGTDGSRFERGVFTGGSFRGRAIDRTLFEFEAKAHDIILEPPVYSAVQCYSRRVKGDDGRWKTVRSGHYFGGGTNFEPTGLAEVIVPERLFDGKPHLKIIRCEVLPVEPSAIVEGDTVTQKMCGPEIANRRLVRLRFDLSAYANCLLDKVGIAVYWRNAADGSGWKSGRGQLSVFSDHTREAAERSGRWRLNQWKIANGGVFPNEIVAIRFGDECFNLTGHMNDRACSFPLWGFCESGRADFAKASPELVQPRVWGYPEIYGAEAYGVAMYRYHLACAGLARAFAFGARSVAPQVKVFRNTTRGGVWDEANDHDGSGQELLTRELDFVHIDPYPVGKTYYDETIPFDMGYMSGLARRYGKPIVPWLQAHAYRPCGLKNVTPDDLDRMMAQHGRFDCDAVMWLGFDLKPGKTDTEMTFPFGNRESWEHVKTIHEIFKSKKNVRAKPVELAVLRPYSVRAICCSQGARWERWRNPADRLLAEYVRAWSVDHGLDYDVFEIPPRETDAEKAAREKELQKYPCIVSTLPYPRARVIGIGTQGTVMTADDMKKQRKEFSEEILAGRGTSDAPAGE